MEQVHLEAKIKKPKLSDMFIWRESLLRDLKQSDQKLVILHAAMGYGKTILMNMYGSYYQKRQAWYHLTATDNDSMLFLEYLTISVKRALPEFSFQLEPVRKRENLAKTQERDFVRLGQDFAFALQKALGEETFCLMLDDFQVIEAPEIYEILEALLHVVPAGVRVFITTKGTMPQFALRFLLNGEALVLSSEALCFSVREIEEVFQSLQGLKKRDEAAGIIHEYTGGWPAGVMFLYLYLKSFRGNIEKENIQDICEKSRVHDFIMYEFFKKLPFELQQFLVRTSVLEYLQSGVCSVVAQVKNAESVLNYLISEGLFIQKIENEINTYRYHQLFQNFLQSQMGEQEKRELAKRAAGYYLRTEEKEQAVEYAIMAGDATILIRALETSGEELLQEGKRKLFRHWMDALEKNLPQEKYSARTLLVLAKYWYGENEEEALHLLSKALKKAEDEREEGIYIRILAEKIEWRLADGEAEEALAECREALGILRPFHKNWFSLREMELKALLFLGREKEAASLCELICSSREQYAAGESKSVTGLRHNAESIRKALSSKREPAAEQMRILGTREVQPEVWDILAARRMTFLCEDLVSGRENEEELALAELLESLRPISAYTAYGFLADGLRLFKRGEYEKAAKLLQLSSRSLNREQLEGWLPGTVFSELKRLFWAMESGYKGEDPHFHLLFSFFESFRAVVLETGDVIKWRTRKAQECVAFLIQHAGKRFSREDLTSVLWDLDELPSNEVAAFHNLLSSIRKSLSPYGLEELIVHEGGKYFLRTEYFYAKLWQAEEITALAEEENGEMLSRLQDELLEVAGHPYLAGLDGGWVRQQRDYYEVRFQKALYILGDYYRRCGQSKGAERMLKKAMELNPYMEEAQKSLLLLHGERRDLSALNLIFNRIRVIWEGDLGAVPNQLESLYAKMVEKCQKE